MIIVVLENTSTPKYCWVEAFNSEDEYDHFLETINNLYPAPQPYSETRRLTLESDKSINWVRFRLRMAFFRYQTDRDPREINVSPSRAAKILELILPTYPGKIGTVYVLINKGLRGLMKVGITRRGVLQRLKELQTTGVPDRFVCIYAATVDNPEEVENRLLTLFTRPSNNREFIKTGVDVAWLLQFHQVKQVTPEKLNTSGDVKEGFDNVPFQGFLKGDYYSVDTRVSFFNAAQEEANFKKWGILKEKGFVIKNSSPIILLSLSGYRYITKKRAEGVKKLVSDILGTTESKTAPEYKEKTDNLVSIATNPMPRVMGEYLPSGNSGLNPINPLKKDCFYDVLQYQGLDDIPFYAEKLSKDVLYNYEEIVFIKSKNLMSIRAQDNPHLNNLDLVKNRIIT